MDDATLVEAARSGGGSAWAEIYDHYADKLHDHCHRILRDRNEAADALHDAFIAASRDLDQLRDPSRLRPWLYSICRHESLRRARQRARVELTDEVDDVVSLEPESDRSARVVELQELVWSAAAGLNERDHALLDLNLRQGSRARAWPTPWAPRSTTPTSCSAGSGTRWSARSARCSSPVSAVTSARSSMAC